MYLFIIYMNNENKSTDVVKLAEWFGRFMAIQYMRLQILAWSFARLFFSNEVPHVAHHLPKMGWRRRLGWRPFYSIGWLQNCYFLKKIYTARNSTNQPLVELRAMLIRPYLSRIGTDILKTMQTRYFAREIRPSVGPILSKVVYGEISLNS